MVLKSNTDPSLSRKNGQPVFIFEFDHLVVRMREATYEILQRLFDDQDVQPVHISRFGLSASPTQIIDKMQTFFGIRKAPAKKLADELIQGLHRHLDVGNIQVSDALRDVIVQAREREMPVFGLTSLPAGPRDIIADRLDLPGLGIEYIPFATNFEAYPKADAWLKLIKEYNVLGPTSIALTTSMAATKAAMTAGFHCVAAPDRFTAFQDFGGAQFVADSLTDIVLADVIPHGVEYAV